MFKKTKSRTGFWTVSPNPACKDSSAGELWGGRKQSQFFNGSFSGTSPSTCGHSDLASEPSLVTVHQLAQIPLPETATGPLTLLRGFLPGCRFPSRPCGPSLGSATSLPGKPWQVMLSMQVCSPSRKKSVVLMSEVKYFEVC